MRNFWSRFNKTASKKQHVFVFGRHSDDWMSALDPEALVWKKLENIKSVKLFSTADEIPKTSRRRKLNTVIIPLMESHLYEMPTNLKSLTSTPDLVSLMADKHLLAQNLITHDFGQYVPKTWTNPADSTFPCVIKRHNLSGGKGIKILTSTEELRTSLSDPEFIGKQYFFQELIPGEAEYVCHIVALNGEILIFSYFEYAMSGCEIIRRWDSPTIITNRGTNLNSTVLDAFKVIIRHLNFSGPCNIDFKLINGAPKIFEINPRFGGSLMVKENLQDLTQFLNIILKNAR
jgi:carbamoylphosphate synthase large subunit